MTAVCLTIGGSDSCGGAGIQADLRTFAALGVTGLSAITALTAQNPREVVRIEPTPIEQLAAELAALNGYYPISAIKTGMFATCEQIGYLADWLPGLCGGLPLIVDPVMVASSGRQLLPAEALTTLVNRLLPLATLITPNLPEAALLLGAACAQQSPEEQATALADKFATNVLLKGGHAADRAVVDLLAMADGTLHRFVQPRLPLTEEQAHGTGCRLSAAICAFISQGKQLVEAVDRGERYLAGQLAGSHAI